MTPRRNPWVYFVTQPNPSFDDHGDVTRAVQDRRDAAARLRPEALQRPRLAGERALHAQLAGVELVVVLRVRRRRPQRPSPPRARAASAGSAASPSPRRRACPAAGPAPAAPCAARSAGSWRSRLLPSFSPCRLRAATLLRRLLGLASCGRGSAASARTRPACGPPCSPYTKIGTCRRPSCTAIVRPTISGMIVDARDQVRITVRAFGALHLLDLLHQLGLDERALLHRSRHGLLLPPPHDELVRRACLRARALAERRLAPRRLRARACRSAPCPRHHRAGGRPGSSPSHAPAAGGRRCRVRPALPSLIRLFSRCPPGRPSPCSATSTRRISPEGRRSSA